FESRLACVAIRQAVPRANVSRPGVMHGQKRPSTLPVNAEIPSARPEPPISPRQGGASFCPAIVKGAEHPAIRHERCNGRIYLGDKSSPSSRTKCPVGAVGKPHFRCVPAANSHSRKDDPEKSRRAPACR